MNQEQKPYVPYVIVGPQGLEYVGLHRDAESCWWIWSGWGDEDDIANYKKRGFECYEATVSWRK